MSWSEAESSQQLIALVSVPTHKETVQTEFSRAAGTFGRRTAGRFDALGVPEFSRVEHGAVVVEVGAGTGNFLRLFAEIASRLIGVDLTHEMLAQAPAHAPAIEAVVADGGRLPLKSDSIDLVASAQGFHHIPEPLHILKEMKRVMAPSGRVLIVDQTAPESFEQAAAMNELEVVRDSSHAASRPPSAFRILMSAAGLEIVDEKVVEVTERLSGWMWPDEFPAERIEAVRDFIERRGETTGMNWRREGDDWVYTRRRIMMLAERPRY
jgi:ubiquinone/menaquinone biosynthesis C-methylase UbiE